MSRLFFLLLGHALTVIGLIGLPVPGLPTAPFLILACGCYGRSSPKFQKLLLENRYTGPPLRDWQKNKAISRRSKGVAVSMLAGTTIYSMVTVPLLSVKIILVITVIVVAYYIITRPAPAPNTPAAQIHG